MKKKRLCALLLTMSMCFPLCTMNVFAETEATDAVVETIDEADEESAVSETVTPEGTSIEEDHQEDTVSLDDSADQPSVTETAEDEKDESSKEENASAGEEVTGVTADFEVTSNADAAEEAEETESSDIESTEEMTTAAGATTEVSVEIPNTTAEGVIIEEPAQEQEAVFKDADDYWYQDSRGWYITDNNGNKYRNFWYSSSRYNATYYLGSDGYMVTGAGWHKIEGKWYYLTGSGVLQTGWRKVGGYYYYLDEIDGHMHTGWTKVAGKWYYMNSSGIMLTGWQRVGGQWYYMNGSGVMLTGWQKIGGQWYYMNGSGVMLTGWQRIGGTWYYMNSSGIMQTGWIRLSGKWYYLNSSGAMVTGWVSSSGKWYWMDSSGAMATDTLIYNVGSDGSMKPPYYYVGSDGVMVTNKWVDFSFEDGSEAWLHFDANGELDDIDEIN